MEQKGWNPLGGLGRFGPTLILKRYLKAWRGQKYLDNYIIGGEERVPLGKRFLSSLISKEVVEDHHLWSPENREMDCAWKKNEMK